MIQVIPEVRRNYILMILHIGISKCNFVTFLNDTFYTHNRVYIFVLVQTELVSFCLGLLVAQAAHKHWRAVLVPGDLQSRDTFEQGAKAPNAPGVCQGWPARCLWPEQLYLRVNMLTCTDKPLKRLKILTKYIFLGSNESVNKSLNQSDKMFLRCHKCLSKCPLSFWS